MSKIPFGEVEHTSPDVRPIMRSALDAIGLPDVQPPVQVVREPDMRTFRVNGRRVAKNDALLVVAAMRADPHPFRDDMPPHRLEQLKRIITLRVALGRVVWGKPL